MKNNLLLFSTLILLLLPFQEVIAQSYTSFFTGNALDSTPLTVAGGICLMGGATEDDEAMKWFLRRANGGDVLVLRASGSDGYNNYFHNSLGVNINSVETIVFNNSSAANEAYVHQKIAQAEAIWFAGGDQWDYISYWRNSPIDSLINDALIHRNIVIGGTSAGMAIQGGFYFSAQNGTITSATALNNPYASTASIDSLAFLQNNYLQEVITDTHYDNPDRKGRQASFLARIYTDYGIAAKGIACDEYTAVCIDTNGLAKVYGTYPTYDDNAYFIQPNCELSNNAPEICLPNTPLTWNQNGQALKVYKIKGTSTASNSFDLNTWSTGTGGTWENWSINNGVLTEISSTAPNCTPLILNKQKESFPYLIYPNPVHSILNIEHPNTKLEAIQIIDLNGQVIHSIKPSNQSQTSLNLETLPAGIYILQVLSAQDWFSSKLIKF